MRKHILGLVVRRAVRTLTVCPYARAESRRFDSRVSRRTRASRQFFQSRHVRVDVVVGVALVRVPAARRATLFARRPARRGGEGAERRRGRDGRFPSRARSGRRDGGEVRVLLLARRRRLGKIGVGPGFLEVRGGQGHALVRPERELVLRGGQRGHRRHHARRALGGPREGRARALMKRRPRRASSKRYNVV